MAEASRDITQLSQLFHHYSSQELVHTEPNTAAYANEVYNLIDTSGQGYVLRILKEQVPESVNWEGAIQGRLNQCGIKTPQYIQSPDGNYFSRHEGLLCTLSKHIDGTPPSTISSHLVTDFGRTLAKIHTCLEGLAVPASSMQWLNYQRAGRDLASYAGVYRAKLSLLLDEGSQIFNRGLPTAVIHGDLWSGNVFASGDAITAVFDFETAEATIRIVDLARTYTAMRRETQCSPSDIGRMLFRGYDSATSTPLHITEKERFKFAVAYVSGVVATWHALHETEYTEPYIAIGEEVLAGAISS